MKDNASEKVGEEQTRSFQPLVQSQQDFTLQAKPEAWNSAQVFHVGEQGSSFHEFLNFHGFLSRKLDHKMDKLKLESVFI